MLLAVPAEQLESERRVALIPDAVKKLVKAGLTVQIETNAGLRAGYSDANYEEAGALVVTDRSTLIAGADLVLRVRKPGSQDVDLLKSGAIHVSYLDPYNEGPLVDQHGNDSQNDARTKNGRTELAS